MEKEKVERFEDLERISDDCIRATEDTEGMKASREASFATQNEIGSI